MKKVLVALLALLVLVGCSTTPVEPEKTDAQKFKEEYEELNGTIREKDGKTIVSLEISETNPMKYATYEDVTKLLDGGTGILYLGFPDCPWCRSLLPVLLEACEDQIVLEVLYYNNKDERDTKNLNSAGEVVTTQEGSDNYYALLERLGEWADVYDGLNDESIKRIYFPTVLFVAEGKIVAKQVSTLSSVSDPYQPLTQAQHDELFDILVKDIQTAKAACDSKC